MISHTLHHHHHHPSIHINKTNWTFLIESYRMVGWLSSAKRGNKAVCDCWALYCCFPFKITTGAKEKPKLHCSIAAASCCVPLQYWMPNCLLTVSRHPSIQPSAYLSKGRKTLFVAQQYSPNHHHTKETPHIKPVKRAEEVLLCVFVAVVVGGQLAVRTRSQQSP